MTDSHDGPVEIALVGDLTDSEQEITDKLLSIPRGGEGVLFIDSPGGSPYCALALMTVILVRELRLSGIVTGECSSAALWPLAACKRRMVTPFSVLLFHPMKWQSEEHVGLAEAAEWARHFGQLETDMDNLLADLFGAPREMMQKWITPGKYVTGKEFVAAGLAEMLPLVPTVNVNSGNGLASSVKAAKARAVN
jgi:ATP-dependent protease ClpP protease subunit